MAVDQIEWENVTTLASGIASGTEEWSATIDLDPGENEIVVTAYDTSGNQASSTRIIDFKQAPLISNIEVSGITGSEATITWDTNINSTSTLEYGTTDSYGEELTDSELETSHSMNLSGLEDGTEYNFRIISRSDSGAEAVSDNQNFTTESRSTGGGGGGGGGGGFSITPDPSDEEDITPPSKITEFNLERDQEEIYLDWVNPEEDNFKEVVVLRSISEIFEYMDHRVISSLSQEVYRGNEESFTDENLSSDTNYFYAIFGVNENNDYSDPTIIKGVVDKPEEEEEEIPKEYKDIKNLAGISSEIVEKVSQAESSQIKSHNQRVGLDDVTIPLYEYIVEKREDDLDQSERYSLAQFIHQGGQTTEWLGAGERAGVVSSYHKVFRRLPRTEKEWQDVIKIANGRWPEERNHEAEEETKNEYFREVYQRDPDMSNPNDSAAVTIITYGLRPAKRNLESEASAINIFRGIYDKTPETTIDWDIVRAIAYSGASR